MSDEIPRGQTPAPGGNRYHQTMKPDDLLERCGIHRPPVDVGAIARQLGVTVTFVGAADWDSAYDVGSRTLYVTEALTATRRRFAIAHGLGHALLHGGRQMAFRERFERQAADPWELEANLFALRLLVPRYWALAYSGYEPVEAVARRFGVTPALVEMQLR